MAKLGDKKTASLGIGLVLFTAKVKEREREVWLPFILHRSRIYTPQHTTPHLTPSV